ncbi:MAG: transcription termination factor Rho [Deltaproteobacteria bacterium]|nr:transcription termination factor Rho [Deltaproteobacteria bacterium]
MEEEARQEETQEKTLEEKLKEGEALDRMTAPDLREIALKIDGVTGVHAMKKEELLKVIKETRGIPLEDPRKKKPGEEKGTIRYLKGKAARLKEEKKTAHANKEKKRVNVLRRRINRLRKQTKKLAGA